MAGLNLFIDTTELVEFSDKMKKAEKVTKPIIAAGINEVGDGFVSVLTTSVARSSGMDPESVRGLLRVKRANRSNLEYVVTMDESLIAGNAIEGKRESRDFGRRDPEELVIIVSKKDDLVCMDCEELAASGPMPMEIARQHVPKHKNCRCMILPYVRPGRRLQVERSRGLGRPKGDDSLTLRQLAQTFLDKTATSIRIEITK
jgi:hypothetical protein